MAEAGVRKALGRGLEALFPGAPPAAARATGVPAPHEVPLADIVPNPEQPRRHFDADALASLADSVRRHGLLQPLVVRRVAGHFELIAGERRLRAAAEAGLESVPVVVREGGGAEERLELAIIENVQRQNLTALEEAEAYRHLIDAYGLTQEEVAARVGKSRPAITNALRLLGLPDAVKARLESGELSAAHARAVLSIEGIDEQVTFAAEIATSGVSKAEAERRAQERRTRSRQAGGAAAPVDVHLRGVAEELTRGLGTRVRIQRRARGGSIEIEFYSDAELNRLVDRLRVAASSRT